MIKSKDLTQRRKDAKKRKKELIQKKKSPLDIPGVDIDITMDEIIECIHESRRTL